MKQIAIINYTFIFDEESPYQNTTQFERDLVLFFANNGMQANSVNVKGNSNTQALYLTKPTLAPPPPINKEPMTFKKPTMVGKAK